MTALVVSCALCSCTVLLVMVLAAARLDRGESDVLEWVALALGIATLIAVGLAIDDLQNEAKVLAKPTSCQVEKS